MKEPIPIACRLTDQELQRRRKNHLDRAAALLLEAEELPDGFSYKFPLSSAILRDLAEIIDLERQCCPFLNFKLHLEAGKDFLTLELSGDEDAKEFIKNLNFFPVD